jgi:hypothetical protein
MTKVMAGMFAIMLAAFALASSYLSGELTSDQINRMFGL